MAEIKKPSDSPIKGNILTGVKSLETTPTTATVEVAKAIADSGRMKSITDMNINYVGADDAMAAGVSPHYTIKCMSTDVPIVIEVTTIHNEKLRVVINPGRSHATLPYDQGISLVEEQRATSFVTIEQGPILLASTYIADEKLWGANAIGTSIFGAEDGSELSRTLVDPTEEICSFCENMQHQDPYMNLYVTTTHIVGGMRVPASAKGAIGVCEYHAKKHVIDYDRREEDIARK